MRKICIVFAVLACTSLASASVIGTWDSGVVVADGTFSGTMYTLTLTSDEGAITGLDMKLLADDYFYNSELRYNGDDGKLFYGTAGKYVDTYFLFSMSSGQVSDYGEDDVTPSDPDQLKASNIYGAMALSSPSSFFDSRAVLQVVVPEGVAAPSLANLRNTSDLNEVGYAKIGTFTDAYLVAVTPEPATMSLLGLGGLALLRRRRK